jgi:hypothetical protein
VADEHHLSFIIPRGASAVEFENAVVLTTPKEKGALVRLNTSLHFVNTRPETGDLQHIHDFRNFARNSKNLEGGFLHLPFGVSHIDDLSTHDPPLGMSNSLTHMHNLLPLWLNLPLVEKVLEAGNISGPRALYSSKYTPAYRQRLTSALEILLDACSYGQSSGPAFFGTDDTAASVVLPAASVVKRQTILQLAAVVNRELPVLQRLHQLVHLLFVQGRRSVYAGRISSSVVYVIYILSLESLFVIDELYWLLIILCELCECFRTLSGTAQRELSFE